MDDKTLAGAISERLYRVNERIVKAAERAGVDYRSIKIVAVTKTFPAQTVRAAYECGLKAIGENRVQEALNKMEQLRDLPQIEWHLVGHLQSNKARKAVEHFALIQSVDTAALAQKLDMIAGELGKELEILLEVNTSGEATKFGIAPERLMALVESLQSCRHLCIRGLMTVGPLASDRRLIARAFALLRTLFEKLKAIPQNNLDFYWLSMGMSDDFEIAIAEGANMLRLGRALFGERK